MVSFTRELQVLLHKSNNEFCKVDLRDGVKIFSFDRVKKMIYCKKIFNGSFTFIDCCFSLDIRDNIYGVINDKIGSLHYIYVTNKVVIKRKLLSYDKRKYLIKNPYIEKHNEKIFLLYYLIDKRRPYEANLILNYFDGEIWVTKTIEKLNYFILTEFKVFFNGERVDVFYFNGDERDTDIYISSFYISSKEVRGRNRITKNGKAKVYLSIIKDELNIYHVAYSENNELKYYCKYLRLLVEDEMLKVKNELIISKAIACEFPSVLKYKNQICILWGEFGYLHKATSSNNGIGFVNVGKVEALDNIDFDRCLYKSYKRVNDGMILDDLFIRCEAMNIYEFLNLIV